TKAAPRLDNQCDAMDRMYRLQKHIYDLTRKYYLLGRDRLLREMELSQSASVLEVGCGTGRNLFRLGEARPDLTLFGLDASEEMLDIAKRKAATNHSGIIFTRCLAEKLNHEKTFGLEKPFDAIFFSYSLSMIPTWRDALHTAFRNLAPDGSVYIVDFWDQRDLPVWFQKILKSWLSMFNVHFRREMLNYIESLSAQNRFELTLSPVAKRYAYIAEIKSII
ncbi:MAG: class I SAM-dependent methyltransferase, partial [Planctomycetes bacterium]|nr:class I SAM-dependent methyltransferase [Planctomycetota bacterium]